MTKKNKTLSVFSLLFFDSISDLMCQLILENTHDLSETCDLHLQTQKN